MRSLGNIYRLRADRSAHDVQRFANHRLLVLLVLLVAVGAAHPSPTAAATITILNADGAGEGFNDSTPRSPVPGNSGTTLGQQRLNAFSAAASYWAGRLSSSVAITVYAQMNPLACSAGSGTLGSAGPSNAFGGFPGAPRPDTWYAAALANALRGEDLDPGMPEIQAQFNSRVGTDPNCLTGMDWWYGVGASGPATTFPFYETVVHELAHGLGFLTLVDLDTGEKAAGYDDIFMTYLEDHSNGKKWPQMSNSERYSSARDTSDLHWTGTQAISAGAGLSAGRHPSGHIQMFAPNPAQPGSSVSHWDTALSPDEKMEPYATANPVDIVTTALLKDTGWTAPQSGPCIRDSRTACLLNNRFEVRVTYTTVSSSGNALVMSFGGARTESDQSVFFYFFDNANFEMGVKMVNACVAPFNKYWAFVSGLTNQGYTVTIRDSVTGTTKTYSNPLGSYPQTVGDTSALNCATTPGGEGDAELLGILPVEELDVDSGPIPHSDSDSATASGDAGGGVDISALQPAAAGRQDEALAPVGAPVQYLSLEDATEANGLDINGEWEWQISGGQVHMRVEDVVNSRGSTTGPLRLTLWASSSPVTGGGTSGYDLGHCNYQALQAGYYYPLMTCDVSYNPPAAGCYYVTILLMEQVDGTWYYQDYASTGQKYALNGGSCSTTGACVRSSTKACLLSGRFEVTVGYQTASTSGAAGVMSFSGQRTESDQSVFFYFFDNANFEMGVKMVDACVDPFNRFWAFVSGLTNQGYIVTIRDTLLDRTKTYSNPLGSYPSTVGDTNAFTCN